MFGGFVDAFGLQSQTVTSYLVQPVVFTTPYEYYFYSRFAALWLRLYEAYFPAPTGFLPAGPGFPTAFTWNDADPDPDEIFPHVSYLLAGFHEQLYRYSSPDGADLNLEASLRTFENLQFRLTSVTAASEVPEPATVSLVALALGAAAFLRRRR